MNVTSVFSHCSADVKGGFLNYFFVTPEVHRWHHTVDVPEGYGYSCNYGVEFSFWDLVFRTYYLPKKDGKFVMPERIGHPSGLIADLEGPTFISRTVTQRRVDRRYS